MYDNNSASGQLGFLLRAADFDMPVLKAASAVASVAPSLRVLSRVGDSVVYAVYGGYRFALPGPDVALALLGPGWENRIEVTPEGADGFVDNDWQNFPLISVASAIGDNAAWALYAGKRYYIPNEADAVSKLGPSWGARAAVIPAWVLELFSVRPFEALPTDVQQVTAALTVPAATLSVVRPGGSASVVSVGRAIEVPAVTSSTAPDIKKLAVLGGLGFLAFKVLKRKRAR